MKAAIILFSLLAVFILPQRGYGMPNLARKYDMSCSGCHNPIPRLNDYGYKFRAAGFRPPEEIGQGVSSQKIGDYTSARTQARYDLSRSEPPKGKATTKNQLTFHEFTFYPITGPFGKYLSSMIEMSMATDEVELENGYLRYNNGTEKKFCSVRFGIMHPFEGYGASDRPLGLSRPLLQTTPANSNQSALFTPWNFDEVGLELGYTIDKTAIRVTLFNGLVSEDLTKAEPAQGGGLAKSPGTPSYNHKDIQVFVNRILTANGGGLSGYFYTGWLDLQTGLSAPDPEVFQDAFMRYALYASYPLMKKGLFLGGAQSGKDKSFDKVAKKSGDKFNNAGFFGECDYHLSEPLWLGARYDQFDPATKTDDNLARSETVMANYSRDTGLQFIWEYQHKTAEKGAAGKQTTDALQGRMIFIW